MRRGVVVMVGLAAGMLLLSLVLQGMETQTGVFRYEQHLEQPSEAELGECTVCGGDAALCTHLPIINIETGGRTIPGRPYADAFGSTAGWYLSDTGEEDITVQFSTVEQEGVWHHSTDAPDKTGTALFRYRGNSSRWFSKGSFRLKIVDDKDTAVDRSMRLMGMESGKEWALYGPFLDKTMVRNYMCMNLAAEVMGTWVPQMRFCELMLDGEYQGLYLLMETIAVDDNRLDLYKYKQGDPVMSYLARIEPYTTPSKELDSFSYYTNRMEPERQLELVYPGVLNQTQQVKDYVQADYNEVERLLYSSEMRSGSGAWKNELDMDSLVNYYILMEFCGINDTFSASTYFYRDVRGKLSIGPVWDFNNAFDNNFMRPASAREFLLSQRGWFAMLMQDEDFVERVISRYRELRETTLSTERLKNYVAEVQGWLGSAIDRNFTVWGYSFDPTQLTVRERHRPEALIYTEEELREVNPSSFEEATEWLVDFIEDHSEWLDENIESLRQYCHASRFANEMLG